MSNSKKHVKITVLEDKLAVQEARTKALYERYHDIFWGDSEEEKRKLPFVGVKLYASIVLVLITHYRLNKNLKVIEV